MWRLLTLHDRRDMLKVKSSDNPFVRTKINTKKNHLRGAHELFESRKSSGQDASRALHSLVGP